MKASMKYDVGQVLFLGSSCIYPKECPQPIKEEYLLSDYLEKTNEPIPYRDWLRDKNE